MAQVAERFSKAVAFAFAGWIAVVAHALAQTDDCLSPMTKFDVCAAARENQEKSAPLLPMHISADVSITSIVAFGPRLAMAAIWKMDEAEFRARLAANNVTENGLQQMMQSYTEKFVCSQQVTAAFVRLGGQVQYTYATTDGHAIASPLVGRCQ